MSRSLSEISMADLIGHQAGSAHSLCMLIRERLKSPGLSHEKRMELIDAADSIQSACQLLHKAAAKVLNS